MHDIDFLPSEYHHRRDRRKCYDRRILLVVLLATVIAAAAWSQKQRSRRLAAQLADCEPARAAAAQTRDALNELQSQLQLARASADLITYLRHPWPRTRIMAALLGPLPDEITFEEVHVEQQGSPGRRPAERRSAPGRTDEEQELAKLPPAARDLKRLREQLDARQTVVTITGVATESAALHQYLSALGRDDLFSKSQLQSAQADAADPKKIHFSATIVVRPGYGQPGGPSGSSPEPATGTQRKTT